MIFRAIYAYPQMSPIRNDLCLFLGPWHSYHYATIALWMEFRSSFLGPAFFALFPKELLKYRMPLAKSAVFFTWLRKAYPLFRAKLSEAIERCKIEIKLFEESFVSKLRRREPYKPNKWMARYIHLQNLSYLFEYALPVILDYGTYLKSADYGGFRQSLLNLMRFYITCEQKGHLIYIILNPCRCNSIPTGFVRLLQFPMPLGEEFITTIFCARVYASIYVRRNR